MGSRSAMNVCRPRNGLRGNFSERPSCRAGEFDVPATRHAVVLWRESIESRNSSTSTVFPARTSASARRMSSTAPGSERMAMVSRSAVISARVEF